MNNRKVEFLEAKPSLRRVDHIIVLENGRLADQGTLDELLERCDEMKRLWQGQV